jgi:hypothetical protein
MKKKSYFAIICRNYKYLFLRLYWFTKEVLTTDFVPYFIRNVIPQMPRAGCAWLVEIIEAQIEERKKPFPQCIRTERFFLLYGFCTLVYLAVFFDYKLGVNALWGTYVIPWQVNFTVSFINGLSKLLIIFCDTCDIFPYSLHPVRHYATYVLPIDPSRGFLHRPFAGLYMLEWFLLSYFYIWYVEPMLLRILKWLLQFRF